MTSPKLLATLVSVMANCLVVNWDPVPYLLADVNRSPSLSTLDSLLLLVLLDHPKEAKRAASVAVNVLQSGSFASAQLQSVFRAVELRAQLEQHYAGVLTFCNLLLLPQCTASAADALSFDLRREWLEAFVAPCFVHFADLRLGMFVSPFFLWRALTCARVRMTTSCLSYARRHYEAFAQLHPNSQRNSIVCFAALVLFAVAPLVPC